MPLTSHSVLRMRLLAHLVSIGGFAQRSAVLDALQADYDGEWTADDMLPQNTRQFETKWRNRTSFERLRLVEAGMLEARSDGVWAITAIGRAQISEVDIGKAAWRSTEVARREGMWTSLASLAVDGTWAAADIRSVGIYNGSRGIYADAERTRSEWSPSGAAVSFLHLGTRYADELDEGGVRYHYPSTERPGRDQAEIDSTERAHVLNLPVFVVALAPNSSTRRVVFRSYVENIDAANRTALITFTGNDELPPAPPLPAGEAPFELVDDTIKKIWAQRTARPNQSRFAFDVYQRYGTSCAVCGLSIPAAIEAAHIRAKSRGGVDDARNGLPLCTNHHRMFDNKLFAVHPDLLTVVITAGLTAADLRITVIGIDHLSARPHEDALRDAWMTWHKAQLANSPAAQKDASA